MEKLPMIVLANLAFMFGISSISLFAKEEKWLTFQISLYVCVFVTATFWTLYGVAYSFMVLN